MKLAGKIAAVTGAGSGIGHETAKLFAGEGATVIVADRDGKAADRVAGEIAVAGGKVSAVKVDVTRESEVKALIENAAKDHGRLDILVNNAGYGFAGTVVTTSEKDWDALMAVNVKGVFFGCKYAIPIMERQGGGVVVNTASTVANVGIADRAAYVASKGAVAALTRAMAIDHVAANIRVNCVAPGTIESPYFAEDLRPGRESCRIASRVGTTPGDGAPRQTARDRAGHSLPGQRRLFLLHGHNVGG